jgi:hypothetical protein
MAKFELFIEQNKKPKCTYCDPNDYDGENPDSSETVKEFSAVILHHHPLYAYYTDKYTGGSNPPDCGSFDGITGVGNPGGDCAGCPFNKFGSGENGAKACKNRRRIYLLREGEIFPMILSLPTGSLKDFTRYIMRLLSKGKKSNSVVTKFALKKATGNSGIIYSQAQFSFDRDLTGEEFALISGLTEQVKAFSVRDGYDNESSVDVAANNEIPVFMKSSLRELMGDDFIQEYPWEV